MTELATASAKGADTAADLMAKRFAADAADHELVVLHDDGLYRHLRFRSPESGFSWFDLVTWPGNLAIKGDHGGFIFCRLEDMFQFFRGKNINPGYWAEKLPDGGRSVREYSEDVLKSLIEEYLPDYAEQYPERLIAYFAAKAEWKALPYHQIVTTQPPVEPKSVDEIRELIAEYDDNGDLGHIEGARELLRELERAGVVSDTWEWDLNDWDFHFLWCCHAIVWGIAQDDVRRRALAVNEAAGGAA